MGLFLDTIEDNTERQGQFVDSFEWVIGSLSQADYVPFVIIDCPSCRDSFGSEAKLQQHIFDVHRGVRFYIKVDDRVIAEDLVYLEKAPDSLTITAMGADGIAKIDICGKPETVALKPGRPVSLRRRIPDSYRGLVTLSICIGAYSREVHIYWIEMPHLEVGRLDSIVALLQGPLLDGEQPDWAGFKTDYIQRPGTNPLEARYLAGFFEYIYGSYLEQSDFPEARHCHERAFGYLRCFRTDLAHTGRSILALKMNWFTILSRCGPNSKFYLANSFFNGNAVEEVHCDVAAPMTDVPKTRLWIDSFQETFLAALFQYYSEDFRGLDSSLAELKRNPLIGDPNNDDKVMLLEARTLIAQGNKTAGARIYAHLRHHPLFADEAERNIA